MKVRGAETAVVRVAGAEQKLVQRAKELEASTSTNSWELADTYLALKKKHGWTGRRIAEECGVSEFRVSRFMSCAKKFAVLQDRPSFWEAFEEVHEDPEDKTAHVRHNSGENEWYTPPDFIEAAREVLGTIELDPATSEVAQKNVKATDYYTAKDDGLARHWKGRTWMNPPYASELVGRFIEKLCGHYVDGSVPEAIVLVNNATDTAWFQLAAKHAAAFCFPSGRIKFLDKAGDPSGAPLQGQALVYFGDDAGDFVSRFGSFGFCVVTHGE